MTRLAQGWSPRHYRHQLTSAGALAAGAEGLLDCDGAGPCARKAAARSRDSAASAAMARILGFMRDWFV